MKRAPDSTGYFIDPIWAAARSSAPRRQGAQSGAIMAESSQSVGGGRRDRMLGITLVLGSCVCWSVMGLFVRVMPDADVWLVVFWRNIFGGLSIIALAMIERRRLSFD